MTCICKLISECISPTKPQQPNAPQMQTRQIAVAQQVNTAVVNIPSRQNSASHSFSIPSVISQSNKDLDFKLPETHSDIIKAKPQNQVMSRNQSFG